ncbi:MAG: hypothetical protein ABIO04_05780 [Ferruginibacter sp.]
MSTLFQNKFTRIIIPLFAILFFLSCQKDISNNNGEDTGIFPDFTTKVTATVVSGFVTDENNAAVIGASVNVGGSITSTDDYGFFEVKNALVVKDAAVVTVTNPGYFRGIKTFMAENGKSAFFRIKLIPKTNSGNIDAVAGGNVTLGNGMVIALPANAVVVASSNVAYTGSVNVAAHWIDPTAADLSQTMPGDLRGVNTDGYLKTLTTYGMAAVELTSASGELLQIATNKKATLTMPVPSAINGTAPSTIPLWSFDEAKGLWKEEGVATKTGNTYVGEVSHFSFWNCDVPNSYVRFDATVKDNAGNPIPYAWVKISVVGSPYNSGYGYTDSSGYVSGAVPDNAQLLLEVFTSYACGTSVYSQNFSTTNVNISLGVITVTTSLGTATVSGTVTDCTNMPVTNGYVVMLVNGQNFRYSLSNTGTYNFTTILCNSTASASFIAEDANSLQQSTTLVQSISAGANTIPNLQACGVSIQQFITYTIDGGAAISFTWPADSLMHSGNGGTTSTCYINGTSMSATPVQNVSFSFPTVGIAPGGVEILESFYSSQLGTQTTTSGAPVNITEYGNVGEFIAGNFTATVSTPAPIVNYTIVCSFRVRRNF